LKKICLGLVLALTVGLGFVSGAAGGGERQYTCTETIHSGGYAYGVIFSGSNQARLQRGCQVFAGGGFHLQWGVHRPAGWVISAEYINTSVGMAALLIAPARISDLIFRATNKLVFTQHGWIFVRRG